MKRSCVAANEQPAALKDRPQLGQVQFTTLHDTGRGGAELLPRRGRDSRAGRTIGWT